MHSSALHRGKGKQTGPATIIVSSQLHDEATTEELVVRLYNRSSESALVKKGQPLCYVTICNSGSPMPKEAMVSPSSPTSPVNLENVRALSALRERVMSLKSQPAVQKGEPATGDSPLSRSIDAKTGDSSLSRSKKEQAESSGTQGSTSAGKDSEVAQSGDSKMSRTAKEESQETSSEDEESYSHLETADKDRCFQMRIGFFVFTARLL